MRGDGTATSRRQTPADLGPHARRQESEHPLDERDPEVLRLLAGHRRRPPVHHLHRLRPAVLRQEHRPDPLGPYRQPLRRATADDRRSSGRLRPDGRTGRPARRDQRQAPDDGPDAAAGQGGGQAPDRARRPRRPGRGREVGRSRPRSTSCWPRPTRSGIAAAKSSTGSSPA